MRRFISIWAKSLDPLNARSNWHTVEEVGVNTACLVTGTAAVVHSLVSMNLSSQDEEKESLLWNGGLRGGRNTATTAKGAGSI